jgi:serine/threonine protein kinase
MELMPLGALKGSISSMKHESWTIRKQIMQDICEACAFLHSSYYPDGRPKRIVLHQDLKSPNVLLCDEGGKVRAKVADFGLAFIREYCTEESKSISVKHNGGTIMYKAPELYVINAKFTKVQFSLP